MSLDALAISKYMDQKYPFCVVDRISDIEVGKRIVGYKNISSGDFYFQSSSNEIPLFVLLELMGQLSELLLRISADLSTQKGFLAGVQNFEIYNINEISNSLIVKNELLASAAGIYKTSSTIYQNDKILCKGVLIHIFK